MSRAYRMTPKRRFLAGILGGRVDRPPVGSATSVANVEQMEITGAFFPDAHLDGEIMAKLAAGAHDILGYDAIMPYFSVQAEAAALGCEVDWGDPDNLPVERSHPWSSPEDVVLPDDFLEKPSTRAVLDAIRILKSSHGNQVAVVGKIMGPWTLAYHTYGVQDFLIETIKKPQKVRGFLEKLKEISISFGLAQIQAGADVLCIADHATGDLVGPWTYRDFLLPYHRQLTQILGCPTVLHICGNTLDRIPYIAESGFDCFHVDTKVDPHDAVTEARGRISLMGGLNNHQVLYAGSSEEVADQTRCAVNQGIHVVGPECAIPTRTPLRNLIEISRTAREMV